MQSVRMISEMTDSTRGEKGILIPSRHCKFDQLCKFHFCSLISPEIKLQYFFDTFQDACLILLGLEIMCGWYKILDSGFNMHDFANFCRPQDIQLTQVSQNITVYLGTVPYAWCHILEYSEMNCMSFMKYNIWLWEAWQVLTWFQNPLWPQHLQLLWITSILLTVFCIQPFPHHFFIHKCTSSSNCHISPILLM